MNVVLRPTPGAFRKEAIRITLLPQDGKYARLSVEKRKRSTS